MFALSVLYLFNPSTEIALAKNSASFTPTRHVAEFERRLSLLPALYAAEKSAILLPYCQSTKEAETLPYYSIAKKRHISIFSPQDLRSTAISVIKPWGWNIPLVNQLLRYGIHNEILPANIALKTIRTLAHRRTTIDIWDGVISYFQDHSADTRQLEILSDHSPICFTSSETAVTYLETHDGEYVLKAPWSNSGRGIFFTKGADSRHIIRRINDTVSAYGAILVEPHWEKLLDFATEWTYDSGKAVFLGYSLFRTDSSGHYLGNLIASQEQLHSEIIRHTDASLLHKTIVALENTLSRILSPLHGYFNTPVLFGLDMLVDPQGNLNPCVELNLRRTMGHVALSLHELTGREFLFIPGEELPVPLKFTTFAS